MASGISIIRAWGAERPAWTEEFEGVVEAGRVAHAGLDDGEQVLDVVAEAGRLISDFAGASCDVDVAAAGC